MMMKFVHALNAVVACIGMEKFGNAQIVTIQRKSKITCYHWMYSSGEKPFDAVWCNPVGCGFVLEQLSSRRESRIAVLQKANCGVIQVAANFAITVANGKRISISKICLRC